MRHCINMEQRIIEIVRNEIARQRELENRVFLAKISNFYDIPLERLIKDSGIEFHFCKGINKSHEQCLKKPKENGYCGFHQKQAPGYKPPVTEKPSAPWD